MKTVYQSESDNCLSSCLASILEIDIEEVPNFYRGYKGDRDTFWQEVNKWLDFKDYRIMSSPCSSLKAIQKEYKDFGYGIITMVVKDTYTAHAFVSYNGLPIHNPYGNSHFHQSGFDEEQAYHCCLVKKFKVKG